MKVGPPQFEVEDRALVWVLVFVVLAVIANRAYGIRLPGLSETLQRSAGKHIVCGLWARLGLAAAMEWLRSQAEKFRWLASQLPARDARGASLAANLTSWSRESACIYCITLHRCAFTVISLMPSSPPTCLLDSPETTREPSSRIREA